MKAVVQTTARTTNRLATSGIELTPRRHLTNQGPLPAVRRRPLKFKQRTSDRPPGTHRAPADRPAWCRTSDLSQGSQTGLMGE